MALRTRALSAKQVALPHLFHACIFGRGPSVRACLGREGGRRAGEGSPATLAALAGGRDPPSATSRRRTLNRTLPLSVARRWIPLARNHHERAVATAHERGANGRWHRRPRWGDRRPRRHEPCRRNGCIGLPTLVCFGAQFGALVAGGVGV